MSRNVSATHRSAPYSATQRPFQISWHGKTYCVNNIHGYHTITENGHKMHIFSATDGRGTFECKFTSEAMAWFLGS